MTLKPKIRRIIAFLEDEYAVPRRRKSRDLLGSLIATILSQNTTSANARAAFGRLRAKFPHWEDLASARLTSIVSAIKPAGLAPQRAPRLKAIVQRLLQERGRASLEFLRKLGDDEVLRYVMSLEGVGPKTASCLLLFDMGRDAFPVDTHVARLARRLGIVGASTSPGRIQDVLEEICPADKLLSLHLNLVRHGRVVCRARRPNCASCVLVRLCPSSALARRSGQRG